MSAPVQTTCIVRAASSRAPLAAAGHSSHAVSISTRIARPSHALHRRHWFTLRHRVKMKFSDCATVTVWLHNGWKERNESNDGVSTTAVISWRLVRGDDRFSLSWTRGVGWGESLWLTLPFKVHWSLYVPQSGHCMYRIVVTLCTAQWSLYVPPGSTLKTLRSAHTVYLRVLCGSQNKQRLFPYTTLTDWFV
jgi:hypothetical protein